MTNIPTEPTEKEELTPQQQKEISERVALVKNSLLSAHYQNRWPSVGLHQIINRLSFLLLERCVIVVLEKKTDTIYKIIHHTCHDPFWKHDFEHYVESVLYKDCLVQEEKKNIIIDIGRLPDRAIETVASGEKEINFSNTYFTENTLEFYGDTYFMFHRIIRGNENWSGARIFPILSIRNNSFLSCLADEFKELFKNPNIKSYLINAEVEKNIVRAAEQWKDIGINKKIGRGINREQPRDLGQYWPEEGSDYFEGKRFEKIEDIFNEEYKRFQKSPLLVGGGNDPNIPNIFFSIRTFSQTEKRFHDDLNKDGTYPYSVRLVIPDAQVRDLKKAFLVYGKKLDQPENRLRFYDDTGNQIEIDDDFFWERIKTSEGVSEILKELSSPLSLCVRGMSDTVFESGYINIKEDPFVFGGRNRLGQLELDKKGASRDYRLYVYFHYMLLMLSPKKKIFVDHREDRLFALIAPGNVGGSPFFCTGFVFTRESQSDHQSWLSCYHFYHSVCHYLMRGVRRLVKDLYLKEIQEIYENSQKHILEGIACDMGYDPQDVCDALNPKLAALSRFYPYGYLEFAIVPDNDRRKYEGTPYFFHSYIENEIFAVNIHAPPFFIRHLDNEPFLERKLVKERLSDSAKRINQKVRGLIRFYKEFRDSSNTFYNEN